MNKICVYAISKNEEKFVDRWYESMKEADYVVVLDTGSHDNTVERLKEKGVIVQQEIIDPWRFDVARNKSLELVPSDANILVCTDLDEVLEPGWADILRREWKPDIHYRATYLYSWSHTETGKEGRVFRYDKIHNKDWVWKYPVHECLYNKELSTTDYSVFHTLDLTDKIKLHHYPDKSKSRKSYLPLLELRSDENPDSDIYGKLYLVHEYYYRGLDGACIQLANKLIRDNKDKFTYLELANLYLFKGDAYLRHADLPKGCNFEDNAIECYTEAICICSTYREPYIALAKIYNKNKEYSAAIFVLKTCLECTVRKYSWLERDTSWSYEPYDLLCIASYYGGKKKDAIAFAAKALSFDPGNERLISNLEQCTLGASDADLF